HFMRRLQTAQYRRFRVLLQCVAPSSGRHAWLGWLKPAYSFIRQEYPITFRVPLALFLTSLGVIAAVWWWLAMPVTLARAPVEASTKLECVSYAPFRNEQTPHDQSLIVSPEQIAEDLVELAKVTKCIRTYSIDNGLDRVPELASKVGLKVLLGIWLGRDRAKNMLLADSAVALVKAHPGVIAAVIVGSEVLLRGDMTVADLRTIIRSVKPRVDVPVTYADVWSSGCAIARSGPTSISSPFISCPIGRM